MYNSITYTNQVPLATTVPVQGYPQQQYGQAIVTQQGSRIPYGADQTQLGYVNGAIPVGNPMQAVSPPAPAASVGFMDKMKSYFQDVYRSDDNLRAYKVFQSQLDSNPAFLKPGSQDKQRVLDLQQKMNIVGIKANINGIYGYATGEAVKEFKRQVGLNDGFLDKDGRPAVTDISTPQMFNVLTSMVQKKINPGSPMPGNPLPVTQEDLLWAQNLLNRVQQFGYKPNKQEYDRYQDVMQRYQMINGGAPSPFQPLPPYQPGPTAPVVTQPPPYHPQPAPVYPTQPSSPYQPQPTAPVVNQPPALTQADVDWAFGLQDLIVNQNYQPSPQEAQRYQDVFARYSQMQQAQPQAPVTQVPQNAPLTEADLQWAMDLQARIERGHRPSQQELDRYTDVFNRYQTQSQAPPQAPVQTQPTQPSRPTRPTTPAQVVEQPSPVAPVSSGQMVSQQELQWALDLQYRIENQNHQPTQQEMARYTDIFTRYNQQQSSPPPTQQPVTAQPQAPVPTAPQGATAQEAQWAKELETRVLQGHNPSQEEIATYNSIQLKMATGGITQADPTGVPVPATTGVLSQADVDWAIQLQQKVQMQGYQPNQNEVARYTDIYSRYQQQLQGNTTPQPPQPQPVQPTQPVMPVAPVSAGTPSQADIQWASQLMAMVQQNGYQPSQQEMARYTDIYNRMQQSPQQQQPQQPQPYQPQPATAPPGMVSVDVSANDPALLWALDLLERYKRGYQPTPQEIMLYEQTIAHKAVPMATP